MQWEYLVSIRGCHTQATQEVYTRFVVEAYEPTLCGLVCSCLYSSGDTVEKSRRLRLTWPHPRFIPGGPDDLLEGSAAQGPG